MTSQKHAERHEKDALRVSFRTEANRSHSAQDEELIHLIGRGLKKWPFRPTRDKKTFSTYSMNHVVGILKKLDL